MAGLGDLEGLIQTVQTVACFSDESVNEEEERQMASARLELSLSGELGGTYGGTHFSHVSQVRRSSVRSGTTSRSATMYS